MFKKQQKHKSLRPDYARITAETCKEFGRVVKTLVGQRENTFKVQEVLYSGGSRFYDVVLIGEDTVIILRYFHGGKQAHLREFERKHWETYVNPEKPVIQDFIRKYSAEIEELNPSIWNVVKKEGNGLIGCNQ